MHIIHVEQNSEEWFRRREGKITGSRAGGVNFAKLANKTDMINVVIRATGIDKDEVKKFSMSELEDLLPEKIRRDFFHKAQKKEYYRILAERMGYDDLDDDGLYEDPRDRGHRLEDDAAKALEKMFHVKTVTVGMCVREDYEEIAISPDRLIAAIDVEEDDIELFENGSENIEIKFEGGVEIKNPGVANHLEIILTNEVPSEYWRQILQYFVVTDIDYLYFVSHNPKVKEKPLHVIKIERKDVQKEVTEQYEQQVYIIEQMEKDLLSLTF